MLHENILHMAQIKMRIFPQLPDKWEAYARMNQVIQIKVTKDKLSLINTIINRFKRNRMNKNHVYFKIEIIVQEKQLKS